MLAGVGWSMSAQSAAFAQWSRRERLDRGAAESRQRRSAIIDEERRRRRARWATWLGDRLLERGEPGGPRAERDVDALVKLAVLLAGEGPPEGADAILDALTPWTHAMRSDHAAALSEALVMRGRIEDADAIWQTLDPIERMQAQLRCLGHRLIAAANVYAGTAQLDAVVQAIIAQPVGTLAELLESDHDEETALAVYSGVRLLYRTLELVREQAPVVVDALARRCMPERVDAGMLGAAQRLRADAERFAIGPPAKLSPQRARDPVVARVEEMVRSRVGPPRGVPDEVLEFVAMLREGCRPPKA